MPEQVRCAGRVLSFVLDHDFFCVARASRAVPPLPHESCGRPLRSIPGGPWNGSRSPLTSSGHPPPIMYSQAQFRCSPPTRSPYRRTRYRARRVVPFAFSRASLFPGDPLSTQPHRRRSSVCAALVRTFSGSSSPSTHPTRAVLLRLSDQGKRTARIGQAVSRIHCGLLRTECRRARANRVSPVIPQHDRRSPRGNDFVVHHCMTLAAAHHAATHARLDRDITPRWCRS